MDYISTKITYFGASLPAFPAWQRKKTFASCIKLVELKKDISNSSDSSEFQKNFLKVKLSHLFWRDNFDLFTLPQLTPGKFEAFQISFGLLDIIFPLRYI